MDTVKLADAMLFLSTLSLRRATRGGHISKARSKHFYPRSPCGERRYWPCVYVVGRSISIHALLAESDTRRASRQQPAGISIHALLAESDTAHFMPKIGTLHFYPRSPCGERPNADIKTPHFTNYFYPRSPCGERHCSV